MSVNNNLKAIAAYLDNDNQILSFDSKGKLISKAKTENTNSTHVHIPYSFSPRDSIRIDIEVDSSTDDTAQKLETLVRTALREVEKNPKASNLTKRVFSQLQNFHRNETALTDDGELIQRGESSDDTTTSQNVRQTGLRSALTTVSRAFKKAITSTKTPSPKDPAPRPRDGDEGVDSGVGESSEPRGPLHLKRDSSATPLPEATPAKPKEKPPVTAKPQPWPEHQRYAILDKQDAILAAQRQLLSEETAITTFLQSDTIKDFKIILQNKPTDLAGLLRWYQQGRGLSNELDSLEQRYQTQQQHLLKEIESLKVLEKKLPKKNLTEEDALLLNTITTFIGEDSSPAISESEEIKNLKKDFKGVLNSVQADLAAKLEENLLPLERVYNSIKYKDFKQQIENNRPKIVKELKDTVFVFQDGKIIARRRDRTDSLSTFVPVRESGRGIYCNNETTADLMNNLVTTLDLKFCQETKEYETIQNAGDLGKYANSFGVLLSRFAIDPPK